MRAGRWQILRYFYIWRRSSVASVAGVAGVVRVAIGVLYVIAVLKQ